MTRRSFLMTGTTACWLVFPQLAAACPSCMGRDDQGYLLKIIWPVGLFLTLPFVIFFVLFFLVRRMQRRQGPHEA
ncbi:MAG: hypothetical protein KC897_02375 [Candidatus Omnitrophica bacterium]|nr:hypothetical protein [Candidatus Omnitrophota bacterium]MCB9721050.1 hypothetical protein [Candidatus Omnitrophota bacterium]